MPDNYTERAWIAISVATTEARDLDHARVGTEHLLLGLLTDGTGASAELLRGAGATLPAARHMVAEVVGTSGSVAPAELPFTPRAQRALERAARFSRQERAQEVDAEHVLLGVLDVEGLACQVLRRLGVDMGQLRGALAIARSDVAPVRAEPMPETPEAPPTPRASHATTDAPVRCPSCRGDLDTTLAERVLYLQQDGPKKKAVAVIYCTACGTALGVTRR